MTKYDPQEIEPRRQRLWEQEGAFRTRTTPGKPKYYCLEMFPYPSGNIHMGHVRNYSIGDVVARFKRMQGYDVLHPMGWDAFGLPAENAAIKHGTHPATWTHANIAAMKAQLQRLGYAYDWDCELATCDPSYYKWEQLFFLRFLEKDLAYRKKSPQNWCPECHTVLANEQVIDGRCWRCEQQVEQKELTQWFVRITRYADELLADLEKLRDGWPERVLAMQRNWIGKSMGAEIQFPLEEDGAASPDNITVFTTRQDTVFGATFMSIAPEHPLVERLIAGREQAPAVRAFAEKTAAMGKAARTEEGLEKEGVFTGAYCRNIFTGKPIPVWAANFVLAEYGTGAVMGVPAHDQRDFDFARMYGLPIPVVIQPEHGDALDPATMTQAYEGPGRMANSGEFTGLDNEEGKRRIAHWLEKNGRGRATVNWRLRDWNISRQRYWGAPIPVVYCDICGIVPEKEENLPVVLPLDIQTHADGRSPLPDSPGFYACDCPKCGRPARRETDTMDTFVESSWYFARFTDAGNRKGAFSREAIARWLPVDQYIGGIEHAILHLLYSRFFVKALRDCGFLELDEPFADLLTQGMVLKDGAKMSKSRGNTVDPTEMIARYGADTVRLFCLFAAPPERDFDWTETGIEGAHRFINRLWRLCDELAGALPPARPCSLSALEADTPLLKELRLKEHATVKKAGNDIAARFQFNTAIAAVMELVNTLYLVKDELAAGERGRKALSSAIASALALLCPITPHLCEELWEKFGNPAPLADEPWPVWQEDALVREMLTIVIQVDGKLRGRLEVPADLPREELEAAVQADPGVAKHLRGRIIHKMLHVPGKLVNIVLRQGSRP